MAHILAGRAKDLVEKVDCEREAWETAAKTAKEKLKATDFAEKKAVVAKKNRALAEKRCAELLAKQNEIDVKLAQAISLNMAEAEELADLKVQVWRLAKKNGTMKGLPMPRILRNQW